MVSSCSAGYTVYSVKIFAGCRHTMYNYDAHNTRKRKCITVCEVQN